MLFELPGFQFVDAESKEEAILFLSKYAGKVGLLAGGTDLLARMKDRITGPRLRIPEVLVNIKTIPGMDQITIEEGTGIRIGSTVSLNGLATSDVISQKFSILARTAREVGTTQIRNMGTIGGNLCQRPRCVYFRHPDFVCRKKGGKSCFAMTGEHRYYHSIMAYGKCAMAHPSDMAPSLVALGATALLASPEGEKEIPLKDFLSPATQFTETVLKPDEFLSGIRVPLLEGKSCQVFLKHRIRRASDFALSSVAVVAQMRDGVCHDIRIVLGGVAPFPYIAYQAMERLEGRKLTEKDILQAADASVEKARPLPGNLYKVDLTKALIARALKRVRNQAINNNRP